MLLDCAEGIFRQKTQERGMSMSLKVNFACLSMSASVDQQTGNLSVFEVLEEVRAQQLPIYLQSLVIALVMEKSSDAAFQGKLMIHILTPDGNQALVGSGDMSVPQEQKRMKAVFRFAGFPVMQFGQHRFVLSWMDHTGSKVGEAILDFDAVQVAGQQQQVPPVPSDPSHTTH